jgi:hypothetical protein
MILIDTTTSDSTTQPKTNSFSCNPNNYTVIPERKITHSHSFNSQENTNPSITEPLFVHTHNITHGWGEKEPYL